jgi:hypothetical protein
MTMKLFRLSFIGTALLLTQTILQAQSSGVYIDTTRSQWNSRHTLIMRANQVESIVGNWGTFGKMKDPYSGVWPTGSTHGHIHEMSILVSAGVIGRDGNAYHISSESYEDFGDYGPTGTPYWWNPLPGYANEHRSVIDPRTGKKDNTSYIANSMDKTTWPAAWPGKDASWSGKWNGYFGKDQFSADQECMYVMDDRANTEFPYYPFSDTTRGQGLGLQVETRMFQWSHPLAEDQIFIHFQVTNISDLVDYNKDVNPIFFGAFADTHPGGEGASDDNSSWSKDDNLVYAWDNDNKGIWTENPGILPGYLGWKYLESPGISDDGIDNDNDGLVDERRDNDAGTYVFGSVGKYGPAKWHWSGDEDGDWMKEVDDVGSDGIGPLDPNYPGPDADGTEGNGRPDQGEPNFGKTDKDESDQIGLTSFYSPAWGSVVASDDEKIWNFIQPGTFQTPAQNANNLWIFASGPFNLKRQQTERFSVCWLFGEDMREIFRNAVVSQQIYNNDYRFTKPPMPPTVRAVAGDKKVILYWDDLAEKSFDPIYGQDFEGYKIFKGTDPQMSESKTITNGYGNQTYRSPIAQFDLNDGLKGMHPTAIGSELGEQYNSGVHYNLGDDTGLRHYYVDSDVQNGVTYYYAVVAYDKGYYKGMDDRDLAPMSPSESTFKLAYDDRSSSCAVVTPNANASNYVPGSVVNNSVSKGYGSSTGKITIETIDPDSLMANHTYEISFGTTPGVEKGIGIPYATTFSVRDTTTNTYLFKDQVIPAKFVKVDSMSHGVTYDWQKIDTSWATTVSRGVSLTFHNSIPTPFVTLMNSNWKQGTVTNMSMNIAIPDTNVLPVGAPMNVSVIFTDSLSGYALKNPDTNLTQRTYFYVIDSNTGQQIPYYFYESQLGANRKWDKTTECLYLCTPKTATRYDKAWALTLGAPPSGLAVLPAAGDVFNFVSEVPFTSADKFYYTTKASMTVKTSQAMSRIAVVPNPYLAAAAWEQKSSLGLGGRGERKIDFIHLPADCTVKIFTQNGILLKDIPHHGAATDGTVSWDLTTSEGLEVAFGIYVYCVESPGETPKIGTFAIIN